MAEICSRSASILSNRCMASIETVFRRRETAIGHGCDKGRECVLMLPAPARKS